MRILVEHGSTDLSNLGDVAMLQVTVERLLSLWPDAEIRVITRDGQALATHVPRAVPVVVNYPATWARLKGFFSARVSIVPERLGAAAEVSLSQILPAPYKRTLTSAVEGSDLVVHAGSGILADPFLPAAVRRLDLFDHAARSGKPTALFSQGVGPLTGRTLKRAISSTLPKVGLITVRDRPSALLLSDLLGEEEAAFPVTGDDALQLARRFRTGVMGDSLGLNLRFAPYSGFSLNDRTSLDSLLRTTVDALGRECGSAVPLAIHTSDLGAVTAWLQRVNLKQAGPTHAPTVPALLEAISSCRLVITGSYHGAVLALGQGIPAICLAKTDYYQRKFSGLASQFPEDCRMIQMDDPEDRAVLPDLAAGLLHRAESRRAALLDMVSQQVQRSLEAYQAWGAQIDRG